MSEEGEIILDDEINDDEIEKNESEDKIEEIPELTKSKERENRLLELRQMLNKARHQNKTAVLDEFKRDRDVTNPNKDWQQKKIEERKKLKASNTNTNNTNTKPEEEEPENELLNVTAAQAEEINKKKRKKADRVAPFGWEIFGMDAMHKSYKKRLEKLHIDQGDSLKAVYEKRRLHESPAEFYPDSNSLVLLGAIDKSDKEGTDRVVRELKDQEKKREQFHRRRQYWECADVDYINERNRVFNEKLKRSFDSYTTEIKQNLERGTAL